MKVFVSYSHKQGEWVRDSLVPVLRASGCDILIDWERFKAGFAVVGQMDSTQHRADRHVLVVTSDYLNSGYCRHEMDRAILSDPDFPSGKVIPVRFDSANLPHSFDDVIHVDLRDTNASEQWRRLIEQVGGDLEVDAPKWIAALDKTKRHLERHECVNLVVFDPSINWRAWLDELRTTRFSKLVEVDLENPATITRPGLVSEILRAAGRSRPVPQKPGDLAALYEGLSEGKTSCVALRHFHRAYDRKRRYGIDFFSSLRYLIMDQRCLVLLVHTRQPVGLILPGTDELSKIDFKTVELG